MTTGTGGQPSHLLHSGSVLRSALSRSCKLSTRPLKAGRRCRYIADWLTAANLAGQELPIQTAKVLWHTLKVLQEEHDLLCRRLPVACSRPVQQWATPGGQRCGGGGGAMAYNADTMSFELPDTDMIYVSGLPTDITVNEVAEHFGSIGIIKFDKKKDQKKVGRWHCGLETLQ